jgi:hypothetical protein
MLLWEHIVLPLLAILALGVMDRHARRTLAGWLVNLGWDACVLALGAAPAVFLSESATRLFGGRELAACWGFAYMLAGIFVAGGIVGSLRGAEHKHDGHAAVALLIGAVLVECLVYVATWYQPPITHLPR